MPMIDVSNDQLAALERGESITIEPQARFHVAVHNDGAVYLLRGPLKRAEWKMLNGHHNASPGARYTAWQDYKHDFTASRHFTITPIFPMAS